MEDAEPRKAIVVAIAVVRPMDRVSIGQRPSDVPLAGCWEFPGGKVEPGESPSDAAARECLEETGVEIVVGEEYPRAEHDYAHARVQLHFFACWPRDASATPQPPYRWALIAELDRYEFPPANGAVLAQLRGVTK